MNPAAGNKTGSAVTKVKKWVKKKIAGNRAKSLDSL